LRGYRDCEGEEQRERDAKRTLLHALRIDGGEKSLAKESGQRRLPLGSYNRAPCLR
jgi:hypothetical protein